MSRRYDELYYMDYTSYGLNGTGCGAASQSDTECPVWYTMAVYDWKWYSQLVVGSAFCTCAWMDHGWIMDVYTGIL